MEESQDAAPSSPNEKKRKSPGARKDPSIPGGPDQGNDSDKIARREAKKNKREAEGVHAESQRLLRETKGIRFTPEPMLQKPVSSLIEKIRQRKSQLAQRISASSFSGASTAPSRDFDDLRSASKISVDGTEMNDEIEFVVYKPPIRLVPLVKQDVGESVSSGFPRAENIESTRPTRDDGDEEDGSNSRPRTPDPRSGRSTSDSGAKSPPRSLFRAPLMESQDLYSDSQLSPFRDESPVDGVNEDAAPALGHGMNLHLDSETQDDDLSRWPEEDDEKENKAPTLSSSPELFPTVSHAGGLVDDEAEDEDDDPLEDEEEEEEDTDGELRDLLTQDTGEKQADIERRAELHSKWLEQQDLAVEDNILDRIEKGWKGKGKKEVPAFLSETQEAGPSSCNSSKPSENEKVDGSKPADFVRSFSLDEHANNSTGLSGRETSSDGKGQNASCLMEDNEFLESSDDEEADEELRRQVFLQESEEKTEFLSVMDDDSSKEIFSLIKKVNVTSTKARTGHTELRRNGAGPHRLHPLEHQSSFARREAITSVATTKHGCGHSRTYVFGRDDSKSRDASRSHGKQEPQIGKQTSVAASSSERIRDSTAQRNAKSGSSGANGSPAKEAKTRGPSLFQVLKQQAADLASGKTSLGLDKSSSRADDLSIFFAIKPSRKPRGSRGT